MFICERCGKEHDGSFGSGRFCSISCANKRVNQNKDKISSSLREYFLKLESQDRVCKTCGSIYHSKDNSRKECFSCLPTVIKRTSVAKKEINSLGDVSKRTAEKIMKRLDIPCTCCGAYVKGVNWDLHHILPKKQGGDDSMSNLTYICPNCHRIAHTEISLLTNNLIPIDKYLNENNINWKLAYYGVTK